MGRITGFEPWSADELAAMLCGDAVPPRDHVGLHGVVLVLCRRVAELEALVQRLRKTAANPGERQ